MKVCSRCFSPARTGLCFGHRGVAAIPHPQKAKRGGEDAFFSHRYGIGVADGVGGFASQNINPAIYTRNVMEFTLEALKRDTSAGGISSLDALTHGWLEANRTGYPGACPATVATIVENVFASVLNLGDCGTLVVRSGRVLYQTTPQQHSFNCPYQLPVDPPSRGEQAKIELRVGDVLLCASDGVLDNVEVDELVRSIAAVELDGCVRVAELIGNMAYANGSDSRLMSPFAKHAVASGYHYVGGKLDDITVVVARVSSAAEVETPDMPALITDLLPNAR